jgi:hypothetical protein
MAGWLNGGMVEWQEWQPNGGIVEWRPNGRMVKWQNDRMARMAEWLNGKNGGIIEWWNGRMAKMTEWRAEWRNGGRMTG